MLAICAHPWKETCKDVRAAILPFTSCPPRPVAWLRMLTSIQIFSPCVNSLFGANVSKSSGVGPTETEALHASSRFRSSTNLPPLSDDPFKGHTISDDPFTWLDICSSSQLYTVLWTQAPQGLKTQIQVVVDVELVVVTVALVRVVDVTKVSVVVVPYSFASVVPDALPVSPLQSVDVTSRNSSEECACSLMSIEGVDSG